MGGVIRITNWGNLHPEYGPCSWDLERSGKLFEVTYLLLWYLGPINKTIPLDYLGATDQGIAQGIPLIYLGVSLLLLCIAILGRKRQLCV